MTTFTVLNKKPCGNWELGKIQESKFYKIAHLFCLNFSSQRKIWEYERICFQKIWLQTKDIAFFQGSLISEGILTLVPLPPKGAKFLPWAESLNFPPFTVNKWGEIWDLFLAMEKSQNTFWDQATFRAYL